MTGAAGAQMKWRYKLRTGDEQAVQRLVTDTGFFSPAEVFIAVELVEESRARGAAAGYEFVFADSVEYPAELDGYACFGKIAVTTSSYDLYWIAVSRRCQGQGLGSGLLLESERRARAAGATCLYVDTSGRDQYEPTRAFYRKMGYGVEAVLRDFYAPGDDKVVLAKRL